MTKFRTRARLFVAAATLLLAGAGAGPVYAQAGHSDFDSPDVNCGSFQRWGHGGWTVTSPTSMTIDNGMQMSFAPGQSFGPGTTVNGIAVPVILDPHSGNPY